MGEVFNKISTFLKKVSGVRWYLILDMDRKTVIDKSPVLPDDAVEKLTEISRLSRELASEASKYSLSARSGSVRSVYAGFDGEGLEIAMLGNNAVITVIDNRLINSFSSIMDKVEKNEFVKCKACGADLTLETIECPKCGRTVPFLVNNCPYCGYELYVKRCPNHHGFVDNNGNPVKRDYGVLLLGSSMGILSAVFVMALSFILPEYETLLYIIGSLLAFSMIGISIYFSTPR